MTSVTAVLTFKAKYFISFAMMVIMGFEVITLLSHIDLLCVWLLPRPLAVRDVTID
jgi:hypothetical protein